jgi:hypothetical protein
MDVLVGREGLLDIVDCGHRHSVVGKIEAIEVPILRRQSASRIRASTAGKRSGMSPLWRLRARANSVRGAGYFR